MAATTADAPRGAAPARELFRQRMRRPRFASVAAAVSCWLALSAAGPEPAHAVDLFPLDDALSGLAGGAADIVEKGFEFVIGKLFGGISGAISKALVVWLTAVPNFSPRTRIAELRELTTALAFGLAFAVITIAVIRYWVAGLSSSGTGGLEAVEGISRTVGALLLILIWPWLFHNGVAVTNQATAALLGDPRVLNSISGSLTRALAVGVGSNALPGIGWIISIIIALAGAGLTLALVLIKVACNAALALLYVGMPIALVLWPIEETAWLARFAAKALVVVLLVPFIWALCFAVFGAIGAEALGFGDVTKRGLLQDGIVTPVTAIGLLYLCLAIPRQLLRAAAVGPGGAGGATAGVAKTLTLGVATRGLGNAVLGGGAAAGPARGAPDLAGSAGRPDQPRSNGPRANTQPMPALAPATSGAARPPGVPTGANSALLRERRPADIGSTGPAAHSLPPSGERAGRSIVSAGVRLATLPGDRDAIARAHAAARQIAAANDARPAPERQRIASQGVRALSPELRDAVGHIQVAHQSAPARQELFLAQMAAPLEGESRSQYNALTTVMSATPEQRAEALREVLGPPDRGFRRAPARAAARQPSGDRPAAPGGDAVPPPRRPGAGP